MAWICDKNGNHRCEIKRLSYNGTFMEVSSITVTVESPAPISFAIGDYIDWDYDGLRYTLDAAAGVEKQARRNSVGDAFVYENLVFFSPLKAAENANFFDVILGNTNDFLTNTEFSFYGTAWDYAKRLEANLCRLYGSGTWKVRIWTNGTCYDATPATGLDTGAWENKLVDVAGIKCLGGFQQIYDLWGCAYVFSVVNGVNYVDFYDTWQEGGMDKIFAYGKGNGLYKIRHTPDADHVLVTRLRPYGSGDNIPANYYLNSEEYHVDGNESSELAISHLMLPASQWTKDGVKHPSNAYLEQNTDLYGVREGVVLWDGSDPELGEIKPSIYGLTIQDLLNLMASGDSYRPDEAKWPDTTQRIDKIITGAAPTDNGAVSEAGYDFTETEASGSLAAHSFGTGGSYAHIDIEFDDLVMGTTPSVSHLAEFRIVPTSQNKIALSFDVQASIAGTINAVTAYLTPYVAGVKVEDATYPCLVSEETISRTVDGITYTKRYNISLLDSTGNPIVFSTLHTGAVTFRFRAHIDFATDNSGFPYLRDEYAVDFDLIRGNKAIDGFFSVTIPQIGFDLSAAVANGAKLCMRSGANQPREFQIIPSSVRYLPDTDTWFVRCKRSVDQSISTYFPNSNSVIAAGDEYYFTGIAMPPLYVEIAAQKLLTAATAWLALHSKPRMLSAVDVDNKIMAVEEIVLKEGMALPISDTDLGITTENQESRVIDNIRIEEGSDAIRTFTITLRDKKEKSSLDAAIRGATSNLATNASVSEAVNAATGTGHGSLTGRDMPNQHPISAITGLEEALLSSGFFEYDPVSGVVKLKSDYDYLGPKKGLIFEANSSEDVNAHLEVVTKNVGGSNILVLHSRLPFYSDTWISAGGISPGGGQAGGNASMSLITGGGRITNGTDTLDVYSMSKVDQLLAVAGTVQTVAGVSPVSGDIPLASLTSALGVGSVASGNTGLVTGGAVWSAIDALPEPMVFKGSLGTGGTITSLPSASSANEGYTYKVITAGTYASQAAKVGDLFISNGTSWIWIPSGDEPSGTVTSVGLTVPTGLSVSGSPITTSGTLAITFASGYSIPTTANQTAWSNKYDKPSGGIPSTDLASGVVTSLGYADTLNGYFTSGKLNVANGGTGKSSWTKYGVVYASGTTTLAQVSNNTTSKKKFLRMTGTGSAGAAPDWDTVAFGDLPTMYIGNAKVKSSEQTAQNLGGIGALTITGTLTISTTKKIYFGDTSHYVELDSNGYFHFSHGVYSDSFVSAGDISSGGGSTGIDALAMWKLLTNNSSLASYDDNTKIAVAHIPDVASTYGYQKAGDVSSAISTAITALNLGTASTHAHTDYVTAIGWDSTNKKLTWSKGGTAQTAIAIAYATAAGKLSNTSKVGDTNQPVYFTANGVPSAISYTIGKSVPSDAVFTDTTYSAGTGIAISNANVISNSGVRSVTINGNYLRVNTNGTDADLTISYATTVKRFYRYTGEDEAGGYDLDTLLSGGGVTNQYTSSNRWANGPSGMSFGGVVQINPQALNSLCMQLAWDVVHNNSTQTYGTGKLWWRDATYHDSATDWGEWRLIYDNSTLTKSVVTGLLDAGDGTYVKLNPGTVEQTISSQISSMEKGVVNFWRKSGNHYTFIGFSNGTMETYLGGIGFKSQSDHNLYRKDGTDYYKFWDASNSNLTTVPWSAQTLTLAGSITGATTITASGQVTVGSLKLGSNTPTLSWDSTNNAWHLTGNFYADGFISAGGVSSGGGSTGIDEAAMWTALGRNSGDGRNKRIHTAHLPALTANNGLTAAYSGTPDNTALTIGVGSSYYLPLATDKTAWDGKQSKVSALGSTTKPVYTSAAGTFAECSTYAGGTAVTLNGSSKAASTASFYAPTTAGTNGYVLTSAGSGAPGWTAQSSLSVGDSAKLNGQSASYYATASSLGDYLPLSGGTMTGDIIRTQTSGSGAFYSVSGASYSLSFGIGSGDTNRGIYGSTESKWLLKFDASNTTIDYGNVAIGSITPTYKLHVGGTLGVNDDVTIAKSGGANLIIRGTSLNNAPGNIIFRGKDEDSNGFKIEAEPYGSYGRVSLNFWSSNNASGSAPYTPNWKRAFRISYNGNVAVGDDTNSFYNTLYAYGNVQVGTSNNAGTLTVYGATSLSSTLGVTGAATLSSTLSVTGASTLTGAVSCGSTLTIPNNTELRILDTASTARSIMYLSSSNNLVIGYGTKDVASGGDTYLEGANSVRLYTYGSAWTVATYINNSQNVTIGSSDLASTNYRFYVNGTSYLSGDVTTGGKIYAGSNIVMPNNIGLQAYNTSNTLVSLAFLNSSDEATFGYGVRASGTSILYGKTIKLTTTDTAAGPDIYIGCATQNKTAANIYFHSSLSTIRNGIKMSAEYATNASRLNFVYYRSNNGNTSPYSPVWTELLKLTYNGYVNINAPSSTPCTVNVNGTLWTSTGMYSEGYCSAGGLSSSSDARLKDNIKDFGYSTSLLMAIKPREWDWNAKTPMKGHAAGFVAQEIEPLLPYAVTERNYKQLTYDIFHALEIAGLQNHETRIERLERENRELKEEVKRLKAN